LKVVAPEGAREKVGEMVPVDTTAPDFGDPDVQFITIPGTREREAALIVSRPSGTTLVLNDLVGNIRGKSGIDGWLLKLAGFAGDQAQIPKPVKLAMVKDSNAVRGQLLQWTQVESLKRIIVSHGEPIEANPRRTLSELASSLA